MNITKPHILLTIIFSLLNFSTYSQITTNSNVLTVLLYIWLIVSFLGEGVIANNHTFQGDPLQIGFFNGENSNVGLDSGIIMGTGDIIEVVPGAFGGFFANDVDDPDLLELASSVPELIGQDFDVTSVNDVAILEFDFVPFLHTYHLNMFLLQKNILLTKTLNLMMFLVFLFQDQI